MTRGLLAAAVLVLLVTAGGAGADWSASEWDMSGDGTFGHPNSGWLRLESYNNVANCLYYNIVDKWYTIPSGTPLYFSGACTMSASGLNPTSQCTGSKAHDNYVYYFDGSWKFQWTTNYDNTAPYEGVLEGSITPSVDDLVNFRTKANIGMTGNWMYSTMFIYISPSPISTYNISGTTACINNVTFYHYFNGSYEERDSTASSSYSFNTVNGSDYRLVFSDGTHYNFTCTGNEVFNYDACLHVSGYTCGITNIKLYNDSAGWVLDDSDAQSGGRENYEMVIDNGESYLISFIDRGTVCQNQTFTCTGNHVLIDYDRCVYRAIPRPSPYAPPYIVCLRPGYDYNIVLFKDEHGNFIENSKVAIYDNTDSAFIQKWTDTSDGYALLGTRYDADHDVMIMLRTFDGIFTLATTYPANGTAAAGDENITTTNWTIPIHYNVDIYPVDQASVPLLDVFCGLAEYTPLNPLSFWGFSMSGSQHVPVTNCSGFSMCDIIAEKGGYETYEETALNWTSKNALIKDYRHTATLTKE